MGRNCSSRCECRGDAPRHADAVRKAASGLRAWARQYRRTDPAMYRMLIADARDLQTVASLIRQGNLCAARNHAVHMDTAARDYIPQAAWDYITR